MVEISTNNQDTWNSLWTLTGDQGDEWKETKINLTAYNSNVLFLRFTGIIGSSFYSDVVYSDMAIDNIKIQQNAVLNVGDTEFLNSIALYPNPTNDILKITNTGQNIIESVRVYDFNSRLIHHVKLAVKEKEHKISIGHLSNGIYLIEFISRENKKTIVQKLIKN